MMPPSLEESLADMEQTMLALLWLTANTEGDIPVPRGLLARWLRDVQHVLAHIRQEHEGR